VRALVKNADIVYVLSPRIQLCDTFETIFPGFVQDERGCQRLGVHTGDTFKVANLRPRK
jgi:hypothetical protein